MIDQRSAIVELPDAATWPADDHSVLRLRTSVPPEVAGDAIKWLAVLLGTIILALAGCSPTFYRRQADRDAYQLIEQTSLDTPDPCGNYSIQVSPASRLFDPFHADHPPMPPDDPAAQWYMHCVSGMRGSPHWLDDGQAAFVENPYWREMLPIDQRGQLRLDADRSVKLALLNSREYQNELEDLYFSSLDVSLQRFAFDSQFFGGYTVDYQADGPDRRGATGSRSDFLISTFPTSSDGVKMTKVFATGAELVVGLANSFMWQFSGPDEHSAITLLDFALVQPLLREAGRAVVLEDLTQVQRDLLYNVRQMERFRRGFYVEVMAGRDAGAGPNRNLRIIDSALSTSGSGFVGGYLGLVQDLQTIRNQESNISALRNSLARLEAIFEAGWINRFQVELTRQALLEAQSRLLRSVTDYETSLDGFKLLLGLPPQTDVVIDDSMIDQFNLIDTEIVPVTDELTELQTEAGDAIVQVLSQTGDVDAGVPVDGGIAWSGELAASLRQLQQILPRVEELRQGVIETNIPRAEEDFRRLDQVAPTRREELAKLQRQLAKRLSEDAAEGGEGNRTTARDESPFAADLQRLEEMPAQWRSELVALTKRLDQHGAALQKITADIDAVIAAGPTLQPDELIKRLRSDVFGPLPGALTALSNDVLELTVLQARARTESVTLLPIEIDAETATQIARVNRRDWMNARANLVDSWREIRVTANALKSDLDILFEGDMSNTGDNPLRLRTTTGRLRVAAQFDAPLTRLAERNAYREAQIRYQQARRDYMEYEDRVTALLRDIVRNIELNQVNFELRRAAIHVAISQVEESQLRLQEPRKPGATQQTQLGATTARDLVQALSQLLSAQNDFLGVWISYQVLRRSLDFDMGTMQLDPEGIWLDPGPIQFPTGGEDPPEGLELVPPGELLLPPAEGNVSVDRDAHVGLAGYFDGGPGDGEAPTEPPPEPLPVVHVED